MTGNTNNAVRMTSAEIAELVGKRHDNVKRTISRLANDGVIQLPQFEEVKNSQALSANSLSKVYVFEGARGRRDATVVVAQLSPEFTAQLVDRWEELEAQVQISQERPVVSLMRDIPPARRVTIADAKSDHEVHNMVRGIFSTLDILNERGRVFTSQQLDQIDRALCDANIPSPVQAYKDWEFEESVRELINPTPAGQHRSLGYVPNSPEVILEASRRWDAMGNGHLPLPGTVDSLARAHLKVISSPAEVMPHSRRRRAH